MTQSKIKRLIQELISKYGDVVIIEMIDYYASRLIDTESSKNSESSNIIDSKKLSDIISGNLVISCRAEFELVKSICEGKDDPIRHYVEVEESKKKYDSEEQQKLRKRSAEEFRRLTGALFATSHASDYYDMVYKFDKMTEIKTTPKEFGQYLQNR